MYKRSFFEGQQNSSDFWTFRNSVVINTYESLQNVDKLFPPSINAEIEQNKALGIQPGDLYAMKREGIIKEILDKPLIQKEYSEESEKLKQWTTNLGELITDFKQIEEGLNDCYLLTEETGKKIEFLYSNWKNTPIFKEVQDSLKKAKLIDRIDELITIETEDKQELIKTANNPDSQTEAVYAAWTRLGELKYFEGSIQIEDWQVKMNDRLGKELGIHKRLKEAFGKIKEANSLRGEALLEKLEETHSVHESGIRKAGLLKYAEIITDKDTDQKFTIILEEHKAEIASATLDNSFYTEIFEELKHIEQKLKPEYCKRLDHSNDNKIIFTADTGLTSFEPVRTINNNFEQLSIGKWDDFKKNDLKATFFDKTEGSNEKNIGWPKYIRSKKDPSVILKFVPGDEQKDSYPFYMATKEITNEQYLKFLKEGGASQSKWTDIIKLNEKILSKPNLSHAYYPGIDIKSPPEKLKYPVTYLTFEGAKYYAEFLNASLPTLKQHHRASIFADELNRNVRDVTWQNDVKQRYNPNCNKIPRPTKPLGAVVVEKDYLEPKEGLSGGINSQQIVFQGSDQHVWPRPVDAIARNNITDLTGNVWEWCDGQILCGGSCLSPPEYTGTAAQKQHDGESTDVDIGFRVVINLSSTQQGR